MTVHDDADRLRIDAWDDGERRVLLKLRGEVDTEQVPALRRCLDVAINRRADQIVLYLNEVTHLGSAGLACLVLAGLEARTVGSVLYVVANRPAVVRPIQVTGLADTVNLHADLADLPPPGAPT